MTRVILCSHYGNLHRGYTKMTQRYRDRHARTQSHDRTATNHCSHQTLGRVFHSTHAHASDVCLCATDCNRLRKRILDAVLRRRLQAWLMLAQRNSRNQRVLCARALSAGAHRRQAAFLWWRCATGMRIALKLKASTASQLDLRCADLYRVRVEDPIFRAVELEPKFWPARV